MFIEFLSGRLSKAGDKIFIIFWQNVIFKITPRAPNTSMITNIHIIKVFKDVCLFDTFWQIYVVVIRVYNRHLNELFIEHGTYFFLFVV